MEKSKTGISGFDKLVGGGLPRKKIILLKGPPGTCKTIFALQYLYNGATMFSENGLYVTFEERETSLKTQALQFGWDFNSLEEENKLKIYNIQPKNIIETTASDLIKMAEEFDIRRLVIDSISALSINTPTTFSSVTDLTEIAVKRFIYNFINSLRNVHNDVTSVLIAQAIDNHISRDSISEFICDGIINITHESLGGTYSRSLTIPKMRETKNDEDVHPLEVTDKGIVIHDLT